MSRYSLAKQVALGLRAEALTAVQDSGRWNVTPPSANGLKLEMPFQFFDKRLAPPSAVLAHKAALSLFSEYRSDRKHALATLQQLSEALKSNQSQNIIRLLKKNPAAEWLSFVFLEPEELQEQLWEPAVQATAECRNAVLSALRSELARLCAHTELLQSMIERMGESA